MVYKIQHEDSAHLLVVCDPESRDIPRTFAHSVENERKVHQLK